MEPNSTIIVFASNAKSNNHCLYFFFFSVGNLKGLAKVVVIFFFYCCISACDQYRTNIVAAFDQYRTCEHGIANSYVYVLKFRVWEHNKLCASEINSNSRFKELCEIPLQPLTTYLHFCNAYGHQTWQGGVLP